MQRQIRTCTQTPTFRKLYIAPLIFIFCSVPGQSEMPHTNVLQTAMTAFSVTKYLRHSEQKRTSEQCHVTNDVIALRLMQEVVIVGVISIRRCTPAGFKLTKLFGIDDFSVAKDFGKVFIIIIYCFYNYHYYYYYYYYYYFLVYLFTNVLCYLTNGNGN